MRLMRYRAIGLVALLGLALGCETTGGGGQLENTVYDSHRRIVKLEQDLNASVNKLNETTAELIARVEENDQQARTVQGILEENQVKLENLQRTLENLSITLHRHFNLSPPTHISPPPSTTTPSAPSEVEPGGPITISPPPAEPSGIGAPGPSIQPPATAGGSPEADYQQAQQSFMNEDYELALKLFDAYLKRYPNVDREFTANAHFWRSYCYFNLGQHEQAVEEFKKLRSNYPDSTKIPLAMYIQAIAHKQLGQTARAVALLKDIVENYPISAASERAKTELEKLQGN